MPTEVMLGTGGAAPHDCIPDTCPRQAWDDRFFAGLEGWRGAPRPERRSRLALTRWSGLTPGKDGSNKPRPYIEAKEA